MRKALWVGLVLALVLVPLMMPESVEAKRMRLGGLATSYAPAVVDTSSSASVATCADLHWLVFFEGDSLLITLQGSPNNSNWVSLATKQVNGTDGTYALQWDGTLSHLGTGGTTYLGFPPPRYVRWIVNNNDAAGADTVGTINFEFECSE